MESVLAGNIGTVYSQNGLQELDKVLNNQGIK